MIPNTEGASSAGIDMPVPRAARKPWYKVLYIQVLIAVALGVILGVLSP